MSIVVGTPGNAYGPTEAISDIITFANDPRVRDVAFTIGRGIKRGYQKARGYFKKRVKPRYNPKPKMSGRGVSGPGAWHGRFPGYLHKPAKRGLRSGFTEKTIYSDTYSQPMVNYFGVCSLPLTSALGVPNANDKGPTRVLDDMCIAVLRKYFKRYHPGRIDMETDCWRWSDYMNKYNIPPADLNFPLPSEELILLSDYPDSIGASAADPTTGATGHNSDRLRLDATSTLRSMAEWMSGVIWSRYYNDGMIPFELASIDFWPTASSGTGATAIVRPMLAKCTMRLNGLIVKANVKTVVKLQNTTAAEATDGTADSGAITSVGSNPIRGKMYYFKGLSPVVQTGYLENVNTTTATLNYANDEWFAATYKWPNVGSPIPSGGGQNTFNVFTSTTSPLGIWKSIPLDQYFRNLVGVKNVELEPGVQKFETLSFEYKGTLVNFLRKFMNWFGAGTAHVDARNNAYYQFGLGNCVMFAFEKRIRSDGTAGDSTNIGLAYQVETDIWTDVKVTTPVMGKRIETFPAD